MKVIQETCRVYEMYIYSANTPFTETHFNIKLNWFFFRVCDCRGPIVVLLYKGDYFPIFFRLVIIIFVACGPIDFACSKNVAYKI